MVESNRGGLLTTFAVLFGLLALSNFMKPFQLTDDTGFVFLGRRLSGTPNVLIGSLFGVYLLVYAVAIWRMKRSALVMAYVYVAYVVLNLILFNLRNPPPPTLSYHLFGIVYSLVAIGVSGGAAYVLTQRTAELK